MCLTTYHLWASHLLYIHFKRKEKKNMRETLREKREPTNFAYYVEYNIYPFKFYINNEAFVTLLPTNSNHI